MAKKAGAKAKKARVAIKDLDVSGRKGASKSAKDVKGGFAPQPEPPKIAPIGSIGRTIRGT
jgi:hypothetical protein